MIYHIVGLRAPGASEPAGAALVAIAFGPGGSYNIASMCIICDIYIYTHTYT